MGDETWDTQAGSPPDRPAPEIVPVHLDPPTRFALGELTSDGRSVDDAVRAAIIEAGARHAEERRAAEHPGRKSATKSESLEDWVARQVATAPPLSACQVYVLRAAFLEGRIVHGCGALERPDSWPGPDHRELDRCRAPACLADIYGPPDIQPLA